MAVQTIADGLLGRSRASAYEARGASAVAMEATDPEVVVEGPAGTGKSRGCLEKVHWLCSQYPGIRVMIARKTRRSLTDSTMVTFERDVLPPDSPVRSGPQRTHRHAYHYPNGSEIVLQGLDRVSHQMSSDYDLIYVPEANELFEDDWEMLSTRMRSGVLPYQQLLGDLNPQAPKHWMHRRCDAGQTRVLFSRHEDNPMLFDAAAGTWTPRGAAYIARLDALTGVRYLRLRLGQRSAVEGGVYAFDRAVHLIDRFEIPPEWPRYRAIDFGYNNPFVCQWWAVDPDGRLYLYRELYMTRRTVSRHAPKIIELSAGERFVEDIADHDAEDRATLAENGITTTPAIKTIRPGIQAVEDRLVVQPDGKPRLFILRDSLVELDDELASAKLPVCTEQEFDVYLYPKGSDGRAVKEIPVDKDNHGMDAMRYMVMALNRGPATIRSLFDD